VQETDWQAADVDTVRGLLDAMPEQAVLG